MSEQFWLKDPTVLFNKKYVRNLLPTQGDNYAAKLNAITRSIILLTILGFILTRSHRILVSAGVALIVIIIMYNANVGNEKKNAIRDAIKEGFQSEVLYNVAKPELTTPKKQNPMMNVMLPEIQDNPERKMAAPAFAPPVEKEINDAVKETLDPRLFKDLGDSIDFEDSMRQFYTNPNTLIPNDQKGFAEFCYGGMKSCKEGDGEQCDSKNYRYINP